MPLPWPLPAPPAPPPPPTASRRPQRPPPTTWLSITYLRYTARRTAVPSRTVATGAPPVGTLPCGRTRSSRQHSIYDKHVPVIQHEPTKAIAIYTRISEDRGGQALNVDNQEKLS